MKIKLAVAAAFLSVIFSVGLYNAAQPQLAVISIEGPITDDVAAGVAEDVAYVNGNDHVKAVLLVVNSPGGEVFATTVVYDELNKINVPVVGWCDRMCASGAVYALSATSVKYIGLHTPATAIGSVGVINKIKREPFNECPPMSCRIEIYKSGAVKQAAAPDHVPSQDEMASLQSEVDYLAGVFYDVVAKGRAAHISDTAWGRIKTAQIFFGWDGVEVGLADTVMDRAAAVAKAEELAGVGHLAHSKF